MFGVRTTTIARWSRDGRLASFSTPGGHRRYRLPDVRALLEAAEPVETELDRQTTEDAVRLYGQGWSIRQVAEKFDLDYTTTRRLLKRNGVRFRRRGETTRTPDQYGSGVGTAADRRPASGARWTSRSSTIP